MELDWSELPPELLDMISKKLTIYLDYLRFRAVCHQWRSSATPKPHHLPTQLPWLMFPYVPHSITTSTSFFSLSENKLHRLNLPITPQTRCCGSSLGWIVLLDQSPVIRLLNPLTTIQTQLPPLTTFPNVIDFDVYKLGREYLLQILSNGYEYNRDLNGMRDQFIKKVILSSSPSSSSNHGDGGGGDYIAVAVLNATGDLAFCKHGDEAWTIIEEAQSFTEDVIFHKGLCYAVNETGSIAVCDLSGVSPVVTVITLPPVSDPGIGSPDILYLVDSCGELLLVCRYLSVEDEPEPDYSMVYETIQFDVLKLDHSNPEKPKWVDLESLGDQMLFLGGNSSLCLSALDYSGCEGNCIYFTDDYSEINNEEITGNRDSGVYNLDTGIFNPLPYCDGNIQLFLPPPIWVTPNPC